MRTIVRTIVRGNKVLQHIDSIFIEACKRVMFKIIQSYFFKSHHNIGAVYFESGTHISAVCFLIKPSLIYIEFIPEYIAYIAELAILGSIPIHIFWRCFG